MSILYIVYDHMLSVVYNNIIRVECQNDVENTIVVTFTSEHYTSSTCI